MKVRTIEFRQRFGNDAQDYSSVWVNVYQTEDEVLYGLEDQIREYFIGTREELLKKMPSLEGLI